MRSKKLPEVPCIPNSVGSCPEAIYNARPAKNPVKTVFEMNLIMNPNLKAQDMSAKTPTITATSDAIIKYWLALVIIKEPIVEPTNMEMVEVGPIDNCLDVPKIT